MKYTIRNVIREDGAIGSLSLVNPVGRGYAEWVFTPYLHERDLADQEIHQGPDGMFRVRQGQAPREIIVPAIEEKIRYKCLACSWTWSTHSSVRSRCTMCDSPSIVKV